MDSDNPTELIYCLFNDNRGVCQVCGEPTRFVSYGVGYKKSCSRRCADILTVQKGAETKIQKYGSASYNNVEKGTQTCIEHYGVKNPMMLKELQEKVEVNNLNKYGVRYLCLR